jgi:hypothetical protein
MANNALEASLGLDHWREAVRAPITIPSSDSEDASNDSEGEADSDLEMKLAIRASREEYYGKSSRKRPVKRSVTLPTPSLSPLNGMRKSSSRCTTIALERSNTRSAFRPTRRPSSHSAPSPTRSSRYCEGLCDLLSSLNSPPLRTLDTAIDLADENSATHQTDQRWPKSEPFQQMSSLGSLWGRIGQNSSNPTSDVVHGEL